MLHPDCYLKFINDKVGYGIFAKKFIPKGTLIWVIDKLDQVVTPEEFGLLPECYVPTFMWFSFLDINSNYVLCWDSGKFINHHCDPTCSGSEFGFDIAIKDIQVDEEITDDYTRFIPKQHHAFKCECNANNCQEFIKFGYTIEQNREWQVALKSAVSEYATVEQKLVIFLQEESKDYMNHILTNF